MKRRARYWVNGKSVQAHRYLWEWANGPIPKGWVIHHKDGDKHNNDLDNLEAMPLSQHSKLHTPLGNQRGLGNKSRTGQKLAESQRRALLGNKYALGHKVSLKAREKMGAAKRGKPWTPARRAAQRRRHGSV